MTVVTPRIERSLARPWPASAVVAALFVAAQGLWQALAVLVFFPASWSDQGGQGSIRWEILRSEWGIHLAYAVGFGWALAHANSFQFLPFQT